MVAPSGDHTGAYSLFFVSVIRFTVPEATSIVKMS